MDITLIIPAKNESESLPKVLDELKNFNFKIIVILRHEDKDTIDSISNYKIEIIFQDGFGYGDALIKGINSVKTNYFCIFNADGSFNPNEISNMISIFKNNNSDFVFASRYEKNCGSDDDTIVTYIGNYIFTFLGNFLYKLNITDILYTFVLGNLDKAKKLNLKSSDFSFCVELPIKAKKAGYKLVTSKSYERKRFFGKKKVNAFKDGILILVSMLKLFFFKSEIK